MSKDMTWVEKVFRALAYHYERAVVVDFREGVVELFLEDMAGDGRTQIGSAESLERTLEFALTRLSDQELLAAMTAGGVVVTTDSLRRLP